MTTVVDVEKKDVHQSEDEGEHPKTLQKEIEDATSAYASTATSTCALSTPWSVKRLVVVVAIIILLHNHVLQQSTKDSKAATKS